MTYGELVERAGRQARELAARGVGPELAVPLLAERGTDFITAVLALLAAAAWLPLDPRHPPRRLAQVLAAAGSPLALCGPGLEELLAQALAELPAGVPRPVAVRLADLERGPGAEPRPGDPRALAYVIFTSGSTGVPKGAMVEQRGMLNHLLAKVEDLAITAADVVVQNAPQGFDISVWQMLAPLLVGGTVHVVDDETARDPHALLEEVERGGVTILETVPSFLRALLDEVGLGGAPRSRLAGLRWMIPTGEALPARVCRDWSALCPEVPLLNAYGPTECSDDVAHFPLRAALPETAAQVPIGRPVRNLRLYVLDSAMGPVPIGVTGELLVAGIGVGRGYLGDPGKTAGVFVPDPWSGEPGGRLYRTGDLARRLPDGELEFLGRADHQVKVRGHRIELGEVEAALAAYPEVRACAVLEATAGDRLVAYVATAGAAIAPEELRRFLRERLPEPMVPSGFAILGVLPLTANGKVDRRALSALEPGLEAEPFLAPRNAVEEELAVLWSDVLGVQSVGARDDFFALGGHSLLATRLVSRMREVFAVELPLRVVFEAPTLEGLAARVAAADRSARVRRRPPLRRRPAGESAELSFAQQRLWFLCQLEPDRPLYDDLTALRFSGALDIAALAGTLGEIRRRHEVLRTTFPIVEGRPVQRVAAPAPLALPVVDLSVLPAVVAEAEALRVAAREARRPSDLAAGPLLRVFLLRLAGSEHLLLLGLHHIVTDGWSEAILAREAGAIYPALAAGLPPSLPKLPVQYGDFARWQRLWLEGEVVAEQAAWWREALAGAPALLGLPTDRLRPAVRSWSGASRPVALPAALAAGLRGAAERQGATLYMALLAGFQALLSRYSRQEDVVVGSPIANRTRTELEALVGLFANTLALRADLSGDPTFRELLGRVRETTLGAYAHQDLPFERLVDELRPERSLSHTPVFQVLLALQNVPLPALDLEGLTVRAVETGAVASRFDITLNLVEGDAGLRGTLIYATELFEGATMARLEAHLYRLLEALAADPERRISEPSLLSAAERSQILEGWNDTRADYPRDATLVSLVRERAWRSPATVAVQAFPGGGAPLTYGELVTQADRLARRLRRAGIGPEARVGLCLERTPRLVVALLGVLAAGGAYVPLDPGYPAERLRLMADDAGLAVLLTERALAGILPDPGCPVVLLEDAGAEVAEDGENLEEPLPASLAYVLFTSGSTGRPKGVGVPHGALVNFLVAMQRRLELGSRDVLLAITTLAFDIAGLEIYLPLLAGARVLLLSREAATDGEALRRALEGSGATVLQATPSTWRLLLAAGWEGDPGLVALCGGEAMPPELADHLAGGCRALWNVYGPTETTIWSTAGRIDPERSGPVSIGRPLDNTRVLLLNPDLSPVPAGVPGELYIGGDGLARGYLGRPDLTAERFGPDPLPPAGEQGGRLYRTGDLARCLADGRLELLGRVDQQVKVRGFRIEPAEVEAALARHPAVVQAVVALGVRPPEIPGGPPRGLAGRPAGGDAVGGGAARLPARAAPRAHAPRRLRALGVPAR